MLQDLFDSITNLPYEYMGVRDLFHDGTVQTDGIFRKGVPFFPLPFLSLTRSRWCDELELQVRLNNKQEGKKREGNTKVKELLVEQERKSFAMKSRYDDGIRLRVLAS